MGRYQPVFNPQGQLIAGHFDHPGSAIGCHLAVPPSSASPVLTAVFSAKTSANTSLNQPHQFQAFLFDGQASWTATGKRLGRPPPLRRAICNVTFTSESWVSSDEPTSVDVMDLSSCPEMPTAGGSVSLWMIKLTEADFNRRFFSENYVTFYGCAVESQRFDADAVPREGNFASTSPAARRRLLSVSLSEPPPPTAPPPSPVRRELRLEFLGDSITAGFCNLCTPNPAESNGYLSESFIRSWAYLTAEYFGAAYHAIAWSGFGLVRNCCGGDIEMPTIYSRTVATTAEWSWPFQETHYIPDAVIVNLGSNDNLNASNPQGAVERAYVRAYMSLLHNITLAYTRGNSLHPIHVFLACGPIVGIEGYCPYVEDVLERAKAIRGLSAHFLNVTEGLPTDDTCCGHPNAQGDRHLAGITIARLEEVMKWKKYDW